MINPKTWAGARFFPQSLRSWEKSSGFTVIELLVAVAILAILGTVGFLSLSNYRVKQAAQAAIDEISSAVRATRQRSMAQESGGRWGIHFVNSSAGVSSYTTFQGYTYATGTVSQPYTLPSNVKFYNPFASSTYDLVFSPLTGAPAERKIFTVASGRSGAPIGDVVVQLVGTAVSRLENGVVGYWHLDENASTTAYDASGNGNNGTLTNGPTWQASSNCKAGSCLSFNGTNNYVSFPSGFIQTLTDFTISGWFNWADNGTWSRVFDFGTGTTVNVFLTPKNSGTGTPRFAITTSGNGGEQQLTAPSSVTAGVWHHFAVTRSGNTGTLYIDGASVITNIGMSLSLSSLGSTTQNWLGRSQYVADPYFSGRIDEVRIYNRALSASEILNQYNDLK